MTLVLLILVLVSALVAVVALYLTQPREKEPDTDELLELLRSRGSQMTELEIANWVAENTEPKPDYRKMIAVLIALVVALPLLLPMLSMLHCTLYECNMCGCNHREEADRLPPWLCPECMAKICWATRTDPVERYRKLAKRCREWGFAEEAAFFEKSIKALTAP